ncbi:MAG: hypothetical protein M3530_03820 [Thermoproteota archaeon]|nr:hypothetical protein [Thermoproteota archaeon]
MSQSYTKSCMFCKREIVMSDKGAGKWLPYDLNGSVHECKKEIQTGTKKVETQSPPQSKQPLTIEQMDVRLRRVEKMLFNQGT